MCQGIENPEKQVTGRTTDFRWRDPRDRVFLQQIDGAWSCHQSANRDTNLKFKESKRPWSVNLSSGMGVRAIKDSVANGFSNWHPNSWVAWTARSSASRTS